MMILGENDIVITDGVYTIAQQEKRIGIYNNKKCKLIVSIPTPTASNKFEDEESLRKWWDSDGDIARGIDNAYK